MEECNQEFKALNTEIEKYETIINEKETEIKQAVAAHQTKVKSKSVSDATQINQNQSDESNFAVTIPEFFFN